MDFSLFQLDVDFFIEKLTMSPFLQSVWEPALGSVVYCDLAGVVEHSGIYVGDGMIMHFNRHGVVERVTPEAFSSKASHPAIYVSCNASGPVGNPEAARRAIEWERSGHPMEYNVLFNNCHDFCAACLTGDLDKHPTFLTFLRYVAELSIGAVRWRAWWRGPGSLGNEERGFWADMQRHVELISRVVS